MTFIKQTVEIWKLLNSDVRDLSLQNQNKMKFIVFFALVLCVVYCGGKFELD